jgi:hypothetical protein
MFSAEGGQVNGMHFGVNAEWLPEKDESHVLHI